MINKIEKDVLDLIEYCIDNESNQVHLDHTTMRNKLISLQVDIHLLKLKHFLNQRNA